MQISKFFIAVGILTLGFTFARADEDNPAQAAARAAVAAKLSEIDQMAPATNVNVVLPPIETNVPMNPIPMATNSDMSQNAPTMQTNDLPMNYGTNSVEGMSTNAPPPPMNLTVVTNTPPESNPPFKKTKSSKKMKPMIITGTNSVMYGQDFGAPMTAPPLPISMTKEQKLDALDAQYKADQISPEEYFKQREAILNGE